MAGTIVVDRIESDGSYASTINVASKVNFTGGMQIGGQDTTFAGMRNRIINGAMVIDQRYSGNTSSMSNDGYSLDRWKSYISGGGAITIQRVNDAPTGFLNSAKLTVTTNDTSIASGDYYIFLQRIEGYNFYDLMWGTASAKPVTLSFWVKSSLTGTFSCSIVDQGGGSNYTSYIASYTINQANTWEKKTIVVPGVTTGVWNTTNGSAVQVCFDLGCGSNYQSTANVWTSNKEGYRATSSSAVVATNGATWQVTGVQLEEGTAATDFEYRMYGTELALCQRYYWRNTTQEQYNPFAGGYTYGSTSFTTFMPFPVQMRTRPTGVGVSGATDFLVQNTTNFTSSAITFNRASLNGCSFSVTISGATAGQAGNLLDRIAGSWIEFTGAEL